MSMVSEWFNAVMNVYRTVEVPDSTGGVTESRVDVALAVPCRMRLRTSREMEFSGRLGNKAGVRVYCDYSPTFNEQSDTTRLYLVLNGRTLDVRAIDNPHLANDFLQIDCEERI